jgi:hypothetical protein
MSKYVFWNRRTGNDRRQLFNSAYASRRSSDRRQLPDNDLLLVIGKNGLDRFELLAMIPIISLMSAVMLSSYFSNL